MRQRCHSVTRSSPHTLHQVRLLWRHPPFFTEKVQIRVLNQDCLMEENTQVERLGSELQVQVEKLVAGLVELTKKDRQHLIERAHDDCSKVREDVSQTMSIRHYLTSLLAETDPFLLIWVRSQSPSLHLCRNVQLGHSTNRSVALILYFTFRRLFSPTTQSKHQSFSGLPFLCMYSQQPQD